MIRFCSQCRKQIASCLVVLCPNVPHILTPPLCFTQTIILHSVFVKDSFQDPSQIPRYVDAHSSPLHKMSQKSGPSVSADEESVGTSGRLYYLSWLNCLSCVQIKYRFICSSRTTSFHPLKNAANGGVHGGLSANAFQNSKLYNYTVPFSNNQQC